MNKRIAVFGASGDIGSTVVKQLASSGVVVAAISRGSDNHEPVSNVIPVHLAGSGWSDYQNALQKAHEQLGSIDGVVNCIGAMLLKPIHLAQETEFDEQIAVHLKSSAAILKAAVPLLRKSNATDKSVVLISSIAASRGLPNHEIISAVKGGIEAMTRSAAASYANARIRINAVAPGLTETRLTERIWSNPATRKASEQNHPLKRLGQAEDIASAICWLLSEQSGWITGEILHVDGGMANIQNLKV